MQFIAPDYVNIICMSNYKRYFRHINNPVFITFVTYNRREILISNIELLRNSFKNTLSKYQFEIIAISILKDMNSFGAINCTLAYWFLQNYNKKGQKLPLISI